MQYIKLKESLKDHIVFTQNEIKLIDNSFQRQRLKDWQDKGYIKKIIKGYYIFSDLKINEEILFAIANKIYKPSYISFEMALSFYGLIPESVYLITSASSRKTQQFETEIGNFYYHKLNPKLIFGFKHMKSNNHVYKIAEVEKAILDYFYINARLKNKEDFEELRIDKIIFREQINTNKFERYLKLFNNIALSKRIMRFKKYIYND